MLFRSKLKKRKGLWFTTITVFAVIGIISTMYYLNSMTQRSTKALYEASHGNYMSDLDTKINDALFNLEVVGSLL